MPDTAVVFYLLTKINNKWTFRRTSGNRLRRLSKGSYDISWYEATRKRMETVGSEPAAALAALRKKEAELNHAAAENASRTAARLIEIRVDVSL